MNDDGRYGKQEDIRVRSTRAWRLLCAWGAATLVMTYVWWLQQPPYEKLRELHPYSYPIFVGGHAYGVVNNSGSELRTLPLRGGTGSVVLTGMPSWHTVADGSIWITRLSHPLSSTTPTTIGRPALPLKSGAAPVSSVRVTIPCPPTTVADKPFGRSYRLYRLRAGAPEVALRTCGCYPTVTGGIAYWTDTLRVKTGSEERVLAGAVDGGPARVLLTIRGGNVQLDATDNGVLVTVSPIGYLQPSEMLYVASRDLSVRSICRDFTNVQMPHHPQAAGDVAFWLTGDEYGARGVNMAKLDGSEHRQLLAPTHRLDGLYTHRGRVYVRLWEGEGDPQLRGKGFRLRLCVLRPGVTASLQDLCSLPATTVSNWFDGDWMYFTVDEVHENLFDWSAVGLAKTCSTVLYRYHLPD